MAARPVLRSFAAGEIAPELFGRIDLEKFQSGAALVQNMIVLPHGPVQSRPGFEYVLETKDSTKASRLIPFAWSVEQTMMLEFGDGYIRFHTEGATLLDAGITITGATQANPCVLTYFGADPANGDWLYLADLGGMSELNGRFVKVANVDSAANTFEPADLDGAPIDSLAYTAYTIGGTASPVYEIASSYVEADLAAISYTQSADVLTLCHPDHPVRELRRLGATNWTLTDVVFGPVVEAPTGVTATATGAGATTHRYVVTSIDAYTYEESLASTPDDCTNDLTIAGQYNTVAWSEPVATPVAGSAVYKQKGTAYGYVGQVAQGTLTFVDDNIVPDMSKAPPEAADPFAGVDDYPSAVTYTQQRRCFGATNNRPQNIWMTRSATEANFCQSVPLRDDDAIIFGIKGAQQNRIRHLVPLDDLVALTAGGVYVVRAADGSVLTPSTVDPRPQSSVAASQVQPALAESACLYSQEHGSHVREVLYVSDNTGRAGYSNNDVSLLAPHLFDGYEVVSMAFSNNSTLPVLWAVRDDGVLLGMTYVPSQNVRAWHQHTTRGVFESVATVSEDAEVALYAIVRRTVNGRTVRYIERMHQRLYESLEEVFAVDAGVTYTGPAQSVFWAPHLKGMELVGVADGGAVSVTVSSAGRIGLDAAAARVSLGLAYTPRMETLPVALLASPGYGQGLVKSVGKAHVQVHASSGFFVGPVDGGRMVESRWRTVEDYDTPPALRTGYVPVLLDPLWSSSAAVAIEQRSPLPLKVLSMMLEVAEGG